jgi:ELWxxDGT repeat protein
MKHLLAALLLFSFKSADAQFSFTTVSIPNTRSTTSVLPQNLYAFNGSYYFYAQDTLHGLEVFKGDTAGNAVMIGDINTGGMNCTFSDQDHFYDGRMCGIGGILYFNATNGTKGEELWKYDGTNPPSMAVDIVPGVLGSSPYTMRAFNGQLYFTAYKDSVDRALNNSRVLFVYDPGTNTAQPVLRNSQTVKLGGSHGLQVLNSKLIVHITGSADSGKYYTYDPGTNSFAKFIDVKPGAITNYRSQIWYSGSKYYFITEGPTHGKELFEFDGSTSTRLTNLCPGSTCVDGPQDIRAIYKNRIYFRALMSPFYTPYYYDIVSSTTVLDTVGHKISIGLTDFDFPIEYNNNLIFNGYSYKNAVLLSEPCVYNGIDTPKMIKHLSADPLLTSDPESFVLLNNKVFFLADMSGSYSNTYPTKVMMLIDSTAGSGSGSVKPLQDAIAVKAYPNPAYDVLNLDIHLLQQQQLRILIINLDGKVVFTSDLKTYQTGNNTTAIPIKQLPAGNYFYHINNSLGISYCHGHVSKL